MNVQYVKVWTVSADHKARPKNIHCMFINLGFAAPPRNPKYEAFETFATQHIYACSPTLLPGDYPAEDVELVWQSRLRGFDSTWQNVLPEAYQRSNNDFKEYSDYCDNMDAFARQYLQLKQPVKDQEAISSIEHFIELATFSNIPIVNEYFKDIKSMYHNSDITVGIEKFALWLESKNKI